MDSRNIIFIVLDTVRADALSTYGGEARMQNIDSISKKARVYDMAISPGTYTLPSHLSIFLGKRVRSIKGMKTSGMKSSDTMTDPFLKKRRYAYGEITLAGIMEYFGYRSALFSNNPFVSSPTGLANGFSHVSNMFIEEKIRSNKLSVKAILHLIQNDMTRKSLIRLACAVSAPIPRERFNMVYLGLRKKLNRHFSYEYGYDKLDKGAAKTNIALEQYVRGSKWSRNFIFINYMEGHEGYPTNLVTRNYVEQDKWLHMIGEASAEDLHSTRMAYLKRLEYLDFRVGNALSILKRHGILDDASVIITSDHGQAFMEHGQMFHNVFPYNEVIRVPLIIADFKSGVQVGSGQRIEEPFSLTDLNSIVSGRQSTESPVVSDHTGITEVWDEYLLRLIRSRSIGADLIYRKKLELDRPATAIFYKDYKLIHHYRARKDELYNLSCDPQERENLIGQKRRLALEILASNRK